MTTGHPRHLALAALAVGLALASAPAGVALGAAAATAALGVAAGTGPAARAGVLAAAALLAGAIAGEARLAALDAPGKRLAPGERLEASAHLLGIPQAGPFGSSVELELTTGPTRGARVLARLPREARLPSSVGPGIEVEVTGTVREPRGGPASDFDLAAHLLRRAIAAELIVDDVRATGGRRGELAGAVDAARRRAERAIAAGLEPPSAALARGMVLGQDEEIDPVAREDFRASGLAHVLAVSGQNVMLLAALALPLLAAAGLPRPAHIGATILLIAVYVPLAGAGPSLQRAAVMGAATLVAAAASRPSSRVYALLLAACATLAFNPRALGDPGWQLSFAAVAGIILLAPTLKRGLAGLPRLLAEGVAITVAATLATAPLLAHHFGTVSLAALPANILALPLVAPIMWVGMLRAALGQLAPLGSQGTFEASAGPGAAGGGRLDPPPGGGALESALASLAAFAEAANALLGAALGPLTRALSSLASAAADLPGSRLPLPLHSPTALVIAYAVIALGAVAAIRLAARADVPRATTAARWRRLSRPRRAAAAFAAALVAALGFATATAPPDWPDRLTVTFLDVGQGDATLVQHPDGATLLFDGGPPDGRVAALLRQTGVDRISVLVLTHAARDHHGGLPEVVERYPVDLLLDGGDGSHDPGFRAVVARARDRGARRLRAIAPMTLDVGGLEVSVLSPSPRPPGPAPEDPNPRAVVAVIAAGEFELLLSGDAESPTLAPLTLPDVDAIKVPHHGSADPGLADVLDRLRPETAVIPVGPNSYGHPVPSTVATLRAAGARVYRTDRDGTVRLSVEDGELRVDTQSVAADAHPGLAPPDPRRRLAGGSGAKRTIGAWPTSSRSTSSTATATPRSTLGETDCAGGPRPSLDLAASSASTLPRPRPTTSPPPSRRSRSPPAPATSWPRTRAPGRRPACPRSRTRWPLCLRTRF